MIALKQLIQVAPFPEESKKQLLEKADTLSQDKQFDLLQSCWQLISADYQNRVNFEIQKATLAMAKGEKIYNPEDFQKIEDNLFNELVTRLEAAGSEDKIGEIRKQLGPIIASSPANNPVNQ